MERLVSNFGIIECHVFDSYWDGTLGLNQYSPYDKEGVRAEVLSWLYNIKKQI